MIFLALLLCNSHVAAPTLWKKRFWFQLLIELFRPKLLCHKMLRPLDQAQRRATAVPSMSNMSISTSEFSHIYFNCYWCLPVNQQDINVVLRDNPAALVLKKKANHPKFSSNTTLSPSLQTCKRCLKPNITATSKIFRYWNARHTRF